MKDSLLPEVKRHTLSDIAYVTATSVACCSPSMHCTMTMIACERARLFGPLFTTVGSGNHHAWIDPPFNSREMP